jgi:hypothetical protein
MTSQTSARSADSKLGAGELRSLVTAAVLIAAISTLWNYQYGTENQTEYVLAAERALDSGFLSRDFFTNTTQSFGPRFYFIALLAALGAVAPLPAVFFFLALASNVAISVVTALVGCDIFGSRYAGMLASGMVMSLDTLRLADAATLGSPGLYQATVAMPWVLAAVWAGLRGRLPICGLLAGVGSVLHPIVGFVTGALVLAVATLTGPFQRDRRNAEAPFARLGQVGLAWLALITLASLSFVPYTRTQRLEPAQFVQILAHFRAPHHYLPSTFPVPHYVQAACFVTATLLSWYRIAKWRASLRGVALTVTLITAGVLLACLGGYLFVEVLPSRVWTTAQTFRLLFLVKWLGFLGVAGVIGSRLAMESDANRAINAAPPLFGLMSATTMVVTQAAEAMRGWRTADLMAERIGLSGLIAVTAITVYLILTDQVSALFLILVVIGLFAVSDASPHWRFTIPAVLSLATVAALLSSYRWLPERHIKLEPPRFTLADIEDKSASIAVAVNDKTPPDAVLLTPPQFGMLRLLSHRAIVVDFKLFPFEDREMFEWYQRILDCYGHVSTIGFEAAREMDEHYRSITDTQLSRIRERYGAAYAVLYAGTKTHYPVLAATDSLKLVALSGEPRDSLKDNSGKEGHPRQAGTTAR